MTPLDTNKINTKYVAYMSVMPLIQIGALGGIMLYITVLDNVTMTRLENKIPVNLVVCICIKFDNGAENCMCLWTLKGQVHPKDTYLLSNVCLLGDGETRHLH